jgi:flagellin
VAIKLGSQIAALNATRILNNTAESLSRVSARLASGQRINQASDDAAGLSIASSLNLKSKVYSQAVRSINDASSMLNIAESAVSALAEIVTRQMELAEQAANGLYSGRQRQSLEREANVLRKEYNRIVESTEFNGIKLLDGSAKDIRIQQGFGAEETLQVSIGGQLGFAAGNGEFTNVQNQTSLLTAFYQLAAADFNSDGYLDLISFEESVLGTTGRQAQVALNRGDGTFDTFQEVPVEQAGALIALRDQIVFGSASDFNFDGFIDKLNFDSLSDLKIRYGSVDGFITQEDPFGGIVTQNAQVGDLDGDGIEDVLLSNFDSGTITSFLANGDGTFRMGGSVTTANGPEKPQVADINGDTIADMIVATADGNFQTFLGKGDGTFSTGSSVAIASGRGELIASDFNNDGITDVVVLEDSGGSSAFSVYHGGKDPSGRRNNLQAEFDFSEPTLARRSLTLAKQNLLRLGNERATIGSTQSRLATSAKVLQTRILEYDQARSKIMDADIAEEAAQAIRLKILQQIGSMVLKEATLQPQLALALLK